MIWPPQRPEFSPAEEARAEAEQEERERNAPPDDLQDVAGAEDTAGVYSDADPGL